MKMKNKKPQKNKHKLDNVELFSNLNEMADFNPLSRAPKILLFGFLILIIFALITPWWQTSKGFGRVIAIDPNNRAQNINTPISGRIKKWHVSDGARVKEGQIIAEIVDNDPQIVSRLTAERDAKKRKAAVAKIASETSNINYQRQEELFNKGLSSRREFEQAKIEYKNLLGAFETTSSELAAAETKLSRQQNQIIIAPKDGVILKVLAGNNATVVNAGDKIATFAPNLMDPAIELYINGNDIPLIHQGRKVRIQFEGWPVIQFSGWPSIAIGTFSGEVTSVDPSVSENGKFRIIIKRDGIHDWPDARFLRHGAKVYGWVTLNKVSVAYEIWRQINSFPPIFDEQLKAKEQE